MLELDAGGGSGTKASTSQSNTQRKFDRDALIHTSVSESAIRAKTHYKIDRNSHLHSPYS